MICLWQSLALPTTLNHWMTTTTEPDTRKTPTSPNICSLALGLQCHTDKTCISHGKWGWASKGRVWLSNLENGISLVNRMIYTILVVYMIARVFPMTDVSHHRKGHEFLEVSTDYFLDIRARPPHDPCDSSTVNKNNLRWCWSQYKEHQGQHPCLWSTLRILGFSWSDDAIFAIWQSHPHYFDSSNGTSLGAVSLLLKPKLYEVSLAGFDIKPDFCCRKTNGQGHFEPTNHPPPKNAHECFALVKPTTAGIPVVVAPGRRSHRSGNTEDVDVARFFGSTAETNWRMSLQLAALRGI